MTARAVTTVIASPIGGVLSDRFEKRLVMIGARMVVILTSLAVGVLFFSGGLQPWHIVVLAMLDGAAFSILDPALLSIIPELVDRRALLNAISLTSVIEGLMGIVGAAFAGWMIDLVGAGGVYLSMTCLFALAAASHLGLPKRVTANRAMTMHRDLLEGAHYLLRRPVLVALAVVAFVRIAFSQPVNAFLPAFASKDLGFDAAGLGLLTSALQAGFLVSSVLMAVMAEMRHKGLILLTCGAAGALALIGLMWLRGAWAPFLLIAVGGAFLNAGDVFTRTLMQAACTPSYRGRIASLLMMMSGLVSLTVLPAGAVADALGVPLVTTVLALIVIVTYTGVAIWRPDFRKLE
jgi:MFS family permease